MDSMEGRFVNLSSNDCEISDPDGHPVYQGQNVYEVFLVNGSHQECDERYLFQASGDWCVRNGVHLIHPSWCKS